MPQSSGLNILIAPSSITLADSFHSQPTVSSSPRKCSKAFLQVDSHCASPKARQILRENTHVVLRQGKKWSNIGVVMGRGSRRTKEV